MNFEQLLQSEDKILGDGSLYELLRRHPQVEFDPQIAHASLIYNPAHIGAIAEFTFVSDQGRSLPGI